MLASEGTAAPIAELAGDRPRVVAALEAVPSSARARRLRRGAAAGDADPGRLDAAPIA